MSVLSSITRVVSNSLDHVSTNYGVIYCLISVTQIPYPITHDISTPSTALLPSVTPTADKCSGALLSMDLDLLLLGSQPIVAANTSPAFPQTSSLFGFPRLNRPVKSRSRSR